VVALGQGQGMSAISIRAAALVSDEAQALIAALDAELSRRYPEEGATHFRLDEAEVGPGRGAFLVAYRAAEPVACGAVRKIDASTAELKRMYVSPALRGERLGKRLLEALEAEARALGASRLVLETGTRQAVAIGMYERAGFVRIAPFGEYLSSPLSVCMEKDLGRPRHP
jgi:putative acetyltransferase